MLSLLDVVIMLWFQFDLLHSWRTAARGYHNTFAREFTDIGFFNDAVVWR